MNDMAIKIAAAARESESNRSTRAPLDATTSIEGLQCWIKLRAVEYRDSLSNPAALEKLVEGYLQDLRAPGTRLGKSKLEPWFCLAVVDLIQMLAQRD